MVQKEDLEQLFHYVDGKLIWKENPSYHKGWNTRFAGKVAGSLRSDGYIQVEFTFNGVTHKRKAHQIVWLLHMGTKPKGDLDHINQNPSDNRIENLRDVTHQVNGFNRGPNKRTKSGVKGVAWHGHNKRWTAHISVSGVKHYLGSFCSIEEAAAARQAAEERLLRDL